MMAVILRAEAVLQADTRIKSSMRLSFTSLHPDWMMNTSSSRIDSVILTLISPLENFLTTQGVSGILSLTENASSALGTEFTLCGRRYAHRSATD